MLQNPFFGHAPPMPQAKDPEAVAHEARLQEAIDGIKSGCFTCPNHTAKQMPDVRRSTVIDWLKGKPPQNQGYKDKQIFTYAEEWSSRIG